MKKEKKGISGVVLVGGAAVAAGALLWFLSKKGEAAPPIEPEEPEVGLANLYGRVTDQSTGKVLSGAKVALGTLFVTTDSNGDYLFFEEAPGEYSLSVTKDGYEGVSYSVELVEGNNEFNVQLVSSAPPEEPEEGTAEITNVTLSPTKLTDQKHEYQTSLGLGYWGDPFTISLTFYNPLDTDIWVRPDYALGHLTGDSLEFVEETDYRGRKTVVLRGFDAEKLLYFRLLLQTEYIEGDYSYTTDWQKPWDPKGQNVSSGLAFVRDPDGVPRPTTGDERWLKIPANSSITTTKNAHLGRGISGLVPDVFDLCVVAWRVIYFVYHPGYGQLRVGGQIVTVNWRLEELAPVVAAISNLVEIERTVFPPPPPTCPNCGSTNISSFMTGWGPIYTCQDCGYSWGG